jgi:hypothetical protein
MGPPAWIWSWAMFKKIFPQLDYIKLSISLWETVEAEHTARKIVKAMIAFIFFIFFYLCDFFFLKNF